MDKIYYQPNHLWKGQKAVKKLKELSWEKPKTVKQWLSQQAFWQVHSPAPKRVDRPHYQVTTPNEMHQFDLLYMPSDTLYGNKYKYILARIDAASRYKVTRPLRTKQVRDVAEMIADIYKVGPLTYPKIFQCDNGSEFKGEVTKMLEKQEVKIGRVTMKYKHTHTAFVEALNKILTERLLADLFLYSYENEFLDKLIKEGKRKLARRFNLSYRYIDDLISFNNKRFKEFISDIYPKELTISETTESTSVASYLDLLFN